MVLTLLSEEVINKVTNQFVNGKEIEQIDKYEMAFRLYRAS